MSRRTMERIALRLPLILIVSILSSVTGWAQATAQLSGTVRDPSGAVLPGVEVTVTQTETGVVRTTVTNETGSYSLPNLPLGPYRLEAALSGFRTFVQTGIALAVNSSPVVNPVLGVGQVAETVEVNASAALVETRSVGVGQLAENAKGSSVNMVTKSGTNAFHGNLFEFIRNDLFNAREYFSRTGSTLKRNQFGGTIGGPVVQNRLFFFGGYQGTILRQDPASSRAFVPTRAMIENGDWTAFNACSGINLNRGGFLNNRIDPCRYAASEPCIRRRINLTPDNPCGEVFYRTRSISDEHPYVGRGDY